MDSDWRCERDDDRIDTKRKIVRNIFNHKLPNYDYFYLAELVVNYI